MQRLAEEAQKIKIGHVPEDGAAWPVGQPEPTRKGPELDQNRKT